MFRYVIWFLLLACPWLFAQTTSASGDVAQLQAKAQSGDAAAQYELGKAYEEGKGLSQSDTEAAKWFLASAQLGNALAQNQIGLMYSSGTGVDKDKAEAVKWFRQAAQQGNATAMFNLGAAYYNGDGVTIDDVSSFAWFLLGESLGNQAAADAANRMRQEKSNLQAETFFQIGNMYEKGEELPRNLQNALAWDRKAAALGSATAEVKTAVLLVQTAKGNPDYAEVRSLCEKAAKTYYGPGEYCLGELYDQGHGVPRDLRKAVKWYTDAFHNGNAASAFRLSQMYWNGEGVKQDKATGYGFIYLLAAFGLPDAKQQRENMEKELTPELIQKGKQKAVELNQGIYHFGLKKAPTTN